MINWRKVFDTAKTSNVVKASSRFMLGVALVSFVSSVSHIAMAQGGSSGNTLSFAPGMIEHAQKMRQFSTTGDDKGKQSTPPFIPQVLITPDSTGLLETFQPNGATVTSNNAFFQDLGTNGRTCFTCHQPQEGWAISADGASRRFESSKGKDPLFRLVDGAVCPTADVSTDSTKRQAYKLLIEKGLIRVGLPVPANAEFTIAAVEDPYGCNSNPVTGFTTDPATNVTTGTVSIYRRPLPTANMGFLSAVMWDGRETMRGTDSPFDLEASLRHQAVDATLVHAQADAPPTPEQIDQIVAVQKGLFTAQIADNLAGDLTKDNAKGGPVELSLQLPDFFIGVNDPFIENNPKGIPFTCKIFTLYLPWLGAADGQCGEFNPGTATTVSASVAEFRKSIARGEQLFNNTPIAIAGVSGINDETGLESLSGFCGTCHDTPNVGNHSIAAPLNIGIPDAGELAPPGLDIADLPVFTLVCNHVPDGNPLKGKVYKVTDPGRALISGRCKDIGRFKGPILRGLASRAPYFHNGAAKTLLDAVNFYDRRFNIGFTPQQKTDLVNFLNTL